MCKRYFCFFGTFHMNKMFILKNFICAQRLRKSTVRSGFCHSDRLCMFHSDPISLEEARKIRARQRMDLLPKTFFTLCCLEMHASILWGHFNLLWALVRLSQLYKVPYPRWSFSTLESTRAIPTNSTKLESSAPTPLVQWHPNFYYPGFLPWAGRWTWGLHSPLSTPLFYASNQL